jgi:hypothetical protein
MKKRSDQKLQLARHNPPKKPYQTPALAFYGQVDKLTQGGGGSKTDANGTKTHR